MEFSPRGKGDLRRDRKMLQLLSAYAAVRELAPDRSRLWALAVARRCLPWEPGTPASLLIYESPEVAQVILDTIPKSA